MSSEGSDLSLVEEKLDILIRLMAFSITSNTSILGEKAQLLAKAGLAPKAIAALFDTTPNTVSVLLSSAKRNKKSAKKK